MSIRAGQYTFTHVTYDAPAHKISITRDEFRTYSFLERMHRRRGYDAYWLQNTWGFTVDVATAVHERLRLVNRKGYGLALVWPDLDGVACCGSDPLKLSAEARDGIKRFMASP